MFTQDVSVVFRSCPWDGSALSWWCLGLVLVLLCWCLGDGAVMSRWRLGVLSVVSHWCHGDACVVSRWSVGLKTIVSVVLWWCLGDVSDLCHWCVGDILGILSWCLGDVSVLFVFHGCFGAIWDVSVMLRWSLVLLMCPHAGDALVMSRFCQDGVSLMCQRGLDDILVMSRYCFGSVSWMFRCYLGGVSMILWGCQDVFGMYTGDVLAMFQWCVGSRACRGDILVMCGNIVVMFWWGRVVLVMKIDEHFEWAPKQKMIVRFVFAIGVVCVGNFTQYMIIFQLVYFKHNIPVRSDPWLESSSWLHTHAWYWYLQWSTTA